MDSSSGSVAGLGLQPAIRHRAARAATQAIFFSSILLRHFFVIDRQVVARNEIIERELAELAGERFEIYAIVPTRITPAEASRLKRANVGIRVSIEPTGMGLYKSFAYEIFKRRPSVVVALDGNSAGANTIQEAKNGKREARIFVYRGAKVLYSKAQAIQGYVSTFDGAEVIDSIIASVDKVYKKMK